LRHTSVGIFGFSVLPAVLSNFSFNCIPVSESASFALSFLKGFIIVHIYPAQNTVKMYTSSAQ
jgi:hypothetical protein